MRTGKRYLSIAAALLVVGAALAGGASLLTWATAFWSNDLKGEFSTTAKGSDAAQALIPLAVAALAALGAVLASRGLLRRLIGVLIGIAGLTIVWQGVQGIFVEPTQALTPTGGPSTQIGAAGLDIWGPLLAAVGGLLLVASGVLVVLAPAAKAAMGSKYERGPVRGKGSGAGTTRTLKNSELKDQELKDPELDATTMWKAMDADLDPTDLAAPSDGPTPNAFPTPDGPPTDGVAKPQPEER